MADNTMLAMPVKAAPYAHQRAAFDFVCRLFGVTTMKEISSGAALLMEMGCGKTITAIGITGTLSQHGMIGKVLIVCPLSVIGVWEEELTKFADFPYTVTILSGTMEKKRAQLWSLPASPL